MKDMTTVQIDGQVVELILLNEGEAHEIGRWEKRTVHVGRVWEARIGADVIGYVHYRLLTRERRTPGKRFVNARWQSPGWVASEERSSAPSWREKRSRKDAVESLLWEWRRH